MVIAGSDRTTRRRGIKRQRDPSLHFGAELRQRREEQGVSLETIQDRTGVRRFHLEALEDESLSPFPDEKTALVAVRRYADVLGLDGLAMMQIVGERWRNVGESPQPTSSGTVRAASPPPRRPAPPAPAIIAATGAVAVVEPAGSTAHLSRFPGDTSHLKAFTQTAQVPQVTSRASVHPTLPPGLRFDSTDSIPVTHRYHDPTPGPVALQVAIWSTVLLLLVGGAGIAVHHWRPAWLAKIHLVSAPAGGGSGRKAATPPAPVRGPIVKTTATGPLSATVAVRFAVFTVTVVTQAPCWIHVTNPTSFAPVFSATVPGGTTKTFTSSQGQLSVELGASHTTMTVQVFGKTVPGWSLTPSSAPYSVNFSSSTS